MNRRRVYLTRHAHVRYFDEAGRPLDPRDVPLTEEGRRQAEVLGRALAAAPIDRAVCSGMPRTRETAEIALAGRNLPLADIPAFKEIRAGRLREVPADRLERDIAHAYDAAADPGARFIGGESFQEFAARVAAGWAGLLADPGWTHLFVCAHDAVNRVILAEAAGLGLSSLPVLEQDLGCLNILDVSPGPVPARVLIRALNVTPYDLAKDTLRLTSMESVHRTYTGRREERMPHQA